MHPVLRTLMGLKERQEAHHDVQVGGRGGEGRGGEGRAGEGRGGQVYQA